MFSIAKIFSLLVAMILVSAQAFAAVDDNDDEFFQSGSRSAGERAQTKNYPGARDEQNLEVQTSLNQPSRSPDGANTLSLEGEERPATAPASD